MTSHVYIVDDDDAIRDSLSWMLQSRGISCRDFPSAKAFLDSLTPSLSGCILLDVRMSGMSGNELFEILRERGCHMPVIFLTGHGDVPLAVSALKGGAFDFFEKPCDDNQLVDRIVEALKFDEEQRAAAATAESIGVRLNRLSTRERQVMERVLAGKLNKVIADELHVSMRTVEVHRSSLFEKMGVKTAVELAQILAKNPVKMP